uniref:Uncharacterized protein n=1 Tax=uncultured Armatimonadetes bacterium TaxID=157466 RepID=A0A6J4HRP9_9BACT|nr:hypothetical protein AVDCRST_MAG63-998 [uncultured Armatimonadetes bacterium]
MPCSNTCRTPQRAGDRGMANLIAGGQECSYATLAALVARIPAIDRLLGR